MRFGFSDSAAPAGRLNTWFGNTDLNATGFQTLQDFGGRTMLVLLGVSTALAVGAGAILATWEWIVL